MSTTVRVFKLVSGEEIVGYQVSDDLNLPYVKLERVRAIHLVPQGQHQFGVAMMPYMTSDPDGNIMLSRQAVSAEVETVPAALEQTYRQQTSNIQIASSLMEGLKQ